MVRSQGVVTCLLQGSFLRDVPYAPTHLACMSFHHQPGYPSPTFVLTIRVYPEVSQDGSWLKGRCWEYLTVDVNVMRGHGWSELGSSPNKKTKGKFCVYEKICLGGGNDSYKFLMCVYSFKSVGRSIPLQSYMHQPSGKNLVSSCVPLNVLSMMDAGKHHFTQR